MSNAAASLVSMFETATGVPLRVRIRAWDGSVAGPADAPVISFKSRRALHHIVWSPNALGTGRAYVSGDIDFEGDIVDTVSRALSVELVQMASQPEIKTLLAFLSVVPKFLWLAGVSLPPPKIPEEIDNLSGWGLNRLWRLWTQRSPSSEHYNNQVSDEFFRVMLGESMTFSCAYFATPDTPLVDAQKAKYDLICRKLSLKPGQRLLDVGCGWGQMAIHAAQNYGVTVVGVTFDEQQVTGARGRVEKLGLSDKVEILQKDYRKVSNGPFDAISSIGMGEHVGILNYPLYARTMYKLLKPGGRFLNHQISVAQKAKHMQSNPFFKAYLFPEAELATISTTTSFLEAEGFEIRDVHVMRENYALTCKHWVKNISDNWGQVVGYTSEGRARAWLIYVTLTAIAFDKNLTGLNQVLAIRPFDEGFSGMPLTREQWAS